MHVAYRIFLLDNNGLAEFAFCIKERAMAQRTYMIDASACSRLIWVFLNKNISLLRRGEDVFQIILSQDIFT